MKGGGIIKGMSSAALPALFYPRKHRVVLLSGANSHLLLGDPDKATFEEKDAKTSTERGWALPALLSMGWEVVSLSGAGDGQQAYAVLQAPIDA